MSVAITEDEEVQFIPAASEGNPPTATSTSPRRRSGSADLRGAEENVPAAARNRPGVLAAAGRGRRDARPRRPGYWAATKHADILRSSRDNEIFVSGQGALFDLLPAIFLEMTQSFFAIDPPKHDVLRKLISSAFTPKQVKRLEDQITTAAREVVDYFAADPADADGKFDYVKRCAEPLSARLFYDMFGISEHLRANPTDDLFSTLVQAEVDGRSLDNFEIGAFVALMSVAGTDTAKHTSSLTVRAMTHFPEQKESLRADYDGRIKTAVEEFVRLSSPVMTFRRTAVTLTELGTSRFCPATRSSCSTRPASATPKFSPTRTPSTCPVTRTRTSDSAATERTSAWATTSPSRR